MIALAMAPENTGTPSQGLHPLVSIILPVRNEADFIERALTAVLSQDYPSDRFEVLVVDGCSTDRTPELVRALAARDGRVKLLDNPARIAPCAMNVGTAHAKGEIIVRVDGHCEIAPDYVSRCVAHLLTGEVQGVGGSIETIGQNTLAQAIAAAMSSKFGVGCSAFRTRRNETLLVDSVPFPAYTRGAVELAGAYDEELVRNQDDEYNYRLRKLGGKLLLAADVKSRYYSRGTLRSLWRQYLQYGFWKVRVMQKHPLQMSLRQFVPAAFVLALVAAVLASIASVWAAWALVALAVVYVAANLAASIAVAARWGGKLLAYLPATFALIHFAYGLGFLAGLAWFWNRWGTGTRFPAGRPAAEPAPQRT